MTPNYQFMRASELNRLLNGLQPGRNWPIFVEVGFGGKVVQICEFCQNNQTLKWLIEELEYLSVQLKVLEFVVWKFVGVGIWNLKLEIQDNEAKNFF